MLPLRDDLIDFTLMLFKYRDSVDLDQLHGFWERMISFTFRPEQVGTWTEVDFDNFRFFNYELMLYFMAIFPTTDAHAIGAGAPPLPLVRPGKSTRRIVSSR